VIPAWVVELVAILAKGIGGLVSAQDDAARMDAAMQTAEEMKVVLDRQKFGG
jgi:hypothetical protein